MEIFSKWTREDRKKVISKIAEELSEAVREIKEPKNLSTGSFDVSSLLEWYQSLFASLEKGLLEEDVLYIAEMIFIVGVDYQYSTVFKGMELMPSRLQDWGYRLEKLLIVKDVWLEKNRFEMINGNVTKYQ